MSEKKYDMVNHPAHYNQYEGFEVVDVCKQLRSPDGGGNYLRGNAFKYLARAGWKNPATEIEDLEKAKKYIEFEIDRVYSRKNREEAQAALQRLENPQTVVLGHTYKITNHHNEVDVDIVENGTLVNTDEIVKPQQKFPLYPYEGDGEFKTVS